MDNPTHVKIRRFVAYILDGLIVGVVSGLRGRSPGKVLTGIRIVKSDGSPPGVFRSLVRYLMLAIDTLPGIPLVALISMGASKTDRRLGDMVARTWVVKNSAAGRPAAGFTGEAPAAPPA